MCKYIIENQSIIGFGNIAWIHENLLGLALSSQN